MSIGTDLAEKYDSLDEEWKATRGYTYSEWCEYQHLQATVEPYLAMKRKIKRYKRLKEKIEAGNA